MLLTLAASTFSEHAHHGAAAILDKLCGLGLELHHDPTRGDRSIEQGLHGLEYRPTPLRAVLVTGHGERVMAFAFDGVTLDDLEPARSQPVKGLRRLIDEQACQCRIGAPVVDPHVIRIMRIR